MEQIIMLMLITDTLVIRLENTFNFLHVRPLTAEAQDLFLFHDEVFGILLFIGGFTCYMLVGTILAFWDFTGENYYRVRQPFFSFPKLNHQGALLEFLWTVLPALILGFIIQMSLNLLAIMSYEDPNPDFTLKVTGNQWYWTYRIDGGINYSEVLKFMEVGQRFGLEEVVSTGSTFTDPLLNPIFIEFDSYMTPEEDLSDPVSRQLRLLMVDNSVVLPSYTSIRLLVTSSDVLHSWAVPSFGIKIDACPGRINQVYFSTQQEAEVYGQCSEICGVNHGFMPISIKVIPQSSYFNYLAITVEDLG